MKPTLLPPVTLLGLTLLVMGGCNRADLDTRTYELERLRSDQATTLLSPYLGKTGTVSALGNAVTVRGTPEELARVETVLKEMDRAPSSVQLNFQVIEANGAGEPDPAVADVVDALKGIFRYEGYRLEGEAVMSTAEYGSFSQLVQGRSGRLYRIHGEVRDLGRQGGRWNAFLDVTLALVGETEILQTSVNAPAGQTIVLGSAGPFEGRTGALILVVRPEIEDGPPTLGS